jgi:Transposase
VSIIVWQFGLVDPDLLWKVGRSRWATDKAIRVSQVGQVECPLTILADPDGQAVMDCGGSHHTDSRVAMLIVIPDEEVLAEGPTVLDATEPVRKLRAVLHGAEMAFRKRIVVGSVRAAVSLSHTKIGQQQGHRFRSHSGTAIGMEAELVRLNVLLFVGFFDELSSQFSTFARSHHPADDITSWDKVFDAVEHVVTFGLEHRVFGQIDAIGVDEIQYAKGHKYLTLVYQIDLGVTRLLWVGRERTIESFQGFFTVIGDELASKIVFVCSDMWEPYLKVIREKCSEALHILDRFHIVAKMNKALDEVRAGESRRMEREGYAPVLKKSRWLLLKREENLRTEQRFRLRDLLRYNLRTVRAYLLKEAFQQLWDYNSPVWAGKFLDEWCRQVMRSRIEPMKKIARSGDGTA